MHAKSHFDQGVMWRPIEGQLVSQSVSRLVSQLLSQLVSWCFEPSQPRGITSGLNTNFNLSPSYSFHKSLYHKSFLLKPQLKFYPQFRNAKPAKQKHMFWSLFIFRGLSTREPASGRATYFILLAYTGTGVSHSQHTKKSGEVLEKMQVNELKGYK